MSIETVFSRGHHTDDRHFTHHVATDTNVRVCLCRNTGTDYENLPETAETYIAATKNYLYSLGKNREKVIAVATLPAKLSTRHILTDLIKRIN